MASRLRGSDPVSVSVTLGPELKASGAKVAMKSLDNGWIQSRRRWSQLMRRYCSYGAGSRRKILNVLTWKPVAARRNMQLKTRIQSTGGEVWSTAAWQAGLGVRVRVQSV